MSSMLKILVLILCFPLNFAYQIPSINFDLLDNGFAAAIPDEPGVQGVFYIFHIDGRCPPIMDYITKPKDDIWMSTQRHSLEDNDKVEISVVVQYNSILYDKTETKVLLNERVLSTRNSASTRLDDLEAQCKDYDFTAGGDLKSCKATETIGSRNQRICQGDLIFSEDFDGTALNLSTWTHDVRQRMYYVEEELVAFDDSEKNCFVKDGKLYIVPNIAEEVTEGEFRLGAKCTAVESPSQECNINNGRFFFIKPPVYSAQIHTRRSFNFRYGRVEIRAKLPKGDWLFPYIMLQPISTHAESHYVSQLRIASARGNTNLRTINGGDISGRTLYGGVVLWQNERATQFLKYRPSQQHYGEDFHNYTMRWQKDKITLAVDGETYGEIYDGLDTFNENSFLILSVTVGGFLNFDDSVISPGIKPYKNREPKAALAFWQRKDIWAPTWGEQRALIVDSIKIYAE